jgi:hypothetical protein
VTLPPNLTSSLSAIQQLNLSLRQQLELAEAQVPALNEQIAQLGGIDLIRDAAILGEVIYDRAYSADSSPADGSLLLQAAILVPGGIGLVAWDREEFLVFRGHERPGYRDAQPRFVAFGDLGSALKAMLLPQIEPLLARLLVIVRPIQDVPRPPQNGGWSG